MRDWLDRLRIPDAKIKEANAMPIKTILTRTSHILEIVVQSEDDFVEEAGISISISKALYNLERKEAWSNFL